MERPRDALAEGTELAGYVIGRVLGRGGFGITYEAADALYPDVKVAIKEFLPAGTAVREAGSVTVHPASASDTGDFAKALTRFQDEARTLVALRHPHIIEAQRFIKANGTAYVVMKYEEGRSLGSLLEGHKALPESELRKILPPLLDGLEAVHARHFLHRDIKPDNIYLRSADGSPVLLDFGAARQAMAEDRKASLTEIVTPGYAPYEQYDRYSQQGTYTDIYALGATLYRCVTGQRPPDATSRINALARKLPDPMPPVQDAAKGRYAPALLDAIGKALAVLEHDRPQSVAELRALLGRDAAQAAPTGGTLNLGKAPAPPAAPPPTRSDDAAGTTAAPAPRRRRRVLALGLAAAAVLAGGSYYAWSEYRAGQDRAVAATRLEETQRRAAEQARNRAEQERARDAEAKRKSEAEAEAKRKAEEEARARAEEEAAKKKAEEEARRKAQEEERQRAEADTKRKAEEEGRRKAEEERARAEAEAKRKTEEEEARRKAEEERARAEAEAKRKTEEEEARRQAEAEERARADEKRKAEHEQALADWRQCTRQSGGTDSDAVAACTRVIGYKGFSSRDIANGYAFRADAHNALKQYQQAISDCGAALLLDATNGRAHNACGSAYYNQRQFQRALQDYDKAVEFSASGAHYTNRANTYFQLGQYERAISDYDQAIRLAAKGYHYFYRGLAYTRLGQYQRAIEDFDQSIQLEPRVAATYHNRGNAYVALKDSRRAIQEYDRAIELDRNFRDAYYSRGLTYETMGNQRAAMADYRAAHRLGHPGAGDRLRALGVQP